MKINYFILFSIILILIPGISAQGITCDFTIPAVKLGDPANLITTCSNCSQVNITKIFYPSSNGSSINLNVEMTQFVNTYNYTFEDTTIIGTYIYSTQGDPDGVLVTGNVCFEVNPTGNSLTGVQIVIYLIVVVFLFLSLIFFVSKWYSTESPGGKASYFLGAYTSLLVLTYSVFNILSGYLYQFSYLANILWLVPYVLIILFFFALVITAGYLLIKAIEYNNQEKLIKRGHSREEAEHLTRRKR